MKKSGFCFLMLLLGGCCQQTVKYSNGCCQQPKPDCCVQTVTPCVVQSRVYVVPTTTITTIKSGNLKPEIYDPQPLPPLKIYHSHKSRPHHFVAQYRQFEQAKPQVVAPSIKPQTAAPLVKPQEPHKL